MKPSFNGKQWIRLILVLGCLGSISLLAVQSSVKYYSSSLATWNPAQIGKDQVFIWEERMAAIKQDLPASGVVGYISEMDVPGMDFSPGDTNAEFSLTQYVLVPLIIERGTRRDLIIGNFGPAGYQESIGQKMGVELVQSYGYGIYLLKPRMR